jgi:hypothetical protein
VEVWHYAEVGLTEVDEGGNDGDRVRNKVYQLDRQKKRRLQKKSPTGTLNPRLICTRKTTVSPVPSVGNSSPTVGL